MVSFLLGPWGKLIAALAAVALLWWGWHALTEHYIAEGKAQVEAADARARRLDTSDKQKESKRLQGIADAANKHATAIQADFDAYRAAHPVGAVFVCRTATTHSQPEQGGSTAADSGHAGAGAGPETGAAVPERSEGEAVNVGPELDAIVQGFARLAVQVQRWQQQPVAP